MAKRQKRRTAQKKLNRKLLYGVVLVTIVLLAILVVYYIFFMPFTESWTAAIVDQLIIEEDFINQNFNDTITSLLNASGFDVKYYHGTTVTIDFYRELPLKGSKIMILRAHSAVRNETNTNYVDLFTSEIYDGEGEWQYSGYGDQISIAEFRYTGQKYLAIGPTFVKWSMKGRFDSNCVVILMGCESLKETSMAQALIDKGARVVFGWLTSDVVDSDADASTEQLLQYLLAENPENIQGAKIKINQQPHLNNATLDYYPKNEETKYYTIPKRRNQTLTNMMTESFCNLPLIIAPKWKSVKTKGLSENFAHSST